MQPIETLKDQTIPYRPNRYRPRLASFIWGVCFGLALAWMLALWTRSAAGQTVDPGIAASEAQRRLMDYQQRERFHEDYEADRRVYGVNPDGRDAQGTPDVRIFIEDDDDE